MLSLRQLILREGPLPAGDAVAWALRLARALEALHARGVAHGRLSDEAVLTSGTSPSELAHLATPRCDAPLSAYVAPERTLGGPPSPAADVWALGVTFYHLLTGQPAFEGSTEEELCTRIRRARATPLAVYDLGDDLLQNLVDRMLAKDEAQRLSSTAVRAALEACLQGRDELPTLVCLAEGDLDNDEVPTAIRSAAALPITTRPPPADCSALPGAAQLEALTRRARVARHGLRWFGD